MGTAVYNSEHDSYDRFGAAIIPETAAEMNNEETDPNKKFSVNTGVYQVPDQFLGKEIDWAFRAAASANSKSAGTVWGITFTNEYIGSTENGKSAVQTAGQVLEIIRKTKMDKPKHGLMLGIRTNRCGDITASETSDPVIQIFQQIVRESDFIYCNQYASIKDSANGPEKGAKAVTKFIGEYIPRLEQLNSRIDVRIGEIEWPSEGYFNGPTGDYGVAGLRTFWKVVTDWATSQGIQTQMFEAFDEAWKPMKPNVETNIPETGERHFGLFERINGVYKEKIA